MKTGCILGTLVLAGLAAGPAGCVESRCRTDEDCAAPMVCGAERRCVFECTVDDDCDLADECIDRRCAPSPGCAACTFAHAASSCVHGACSMGDCVAGWVDANGAATDGCEYACTWTAAAETCNELDDDCDTVTDEGFALATDAANCGTCGNVCPPAAHAAVRCAGGACGFVCDAGWFDSNGLADDGCESETCTPATEVCDGRDNDCDGETDEGFRHDVPDSCGPLCTACAFDHAAADCVEEACVLGACDAGWHDINGWDTDGCEYACTPSGDEVCDGVDNDCDGKTDEGLSCCPDDMVAVTLGTGTFCIDKWEASRPDATDVSAGVDPSMATSRPDVLPWWPVTVDDARAACVAAGKRLCNPSEWVGVCRGPGDHEYCYGDTYEPTTCNGIDAFGRDSFHYTPTGSFPACTNEYGIFDINGNVWEMGDDGMVRGGAYNCSDSAYLHRCSFSIDPGSVIAIGFRCCR